MLGDHGLWGMTTDGRFVILLVTRSLFGSNPAFTDAGLWDGRSGWLHLLQLLGRIQEKQMKPLNMRKVQLNPPCPHKIPVAFGPASRLRHVSHSSSHPPNKIRSQWTRKDWIVSGQAMRTQGRRFVTKVDIVGRIPERCATLYELQALRRELKLN